VRGSRAIAALAAVASGVVLAAGCSSGSSSSSSSGAGSTSGSVNASAATSAAAFGGMSGLVAAAKKEGVLNVITLPDNWANYGTIMKDFTAKYGIKINDANPDGSSQDELNAVQQLKGQSRAPDVLDMGTAFAVKGDTGGLLAPYKVASWSSIPASSKATDATYYADYGGYVAIGYDAAKVKTPPASLKDLLKPIYKNEVAINGNPTQAGAAFAAVYAAAIANGGSFSDIAPGIAYFKKLHQEGNFVPVTASAATMESGQTPILIWWDYLLASEVGPGVSGLKIVIPTDAQYAAYYDQAISKTAPHPAAARLWEEYLYSTAGQNLWLQGKARPIELPALVSAGTVDKTAYSALPQVTSGSLTFPSEAQQAAAETVVAQQWPSVIG
jgi:putative spermidine/putrescine transport system substrate-binding protein